MDRNRKMVPLMKLPEGMAPMLIDDVPAYYVGAPLAFSNESQSAKLPPSWDKAFDTPLPLQ